MYDVLSYVRLWKINRQQTGSRGPEACFVQKRKNNPVCLLKRNGTADGWNVPQPLDDKMQHIKKKWQQECPLFLTVFDMMLQIWCNGLCYLLINYCKNLISWAETKKKVETIWVLQTKKSFTHNLKKEENDLTLFIFIAVSSTLSRPAKLHTGGLFICRWNPELY